MDLIDILGYIGMSLFFIKLGLHIYIKRRVDKKFDFGAFGQYSSPVLFFPVTDEVAGKLKILKKIANVIYVIAILLVIVFFIGANMHKS
jgi:hypothetical protein